MMEDTINAQGLDILYNPALACKALSNSVAEKVAEDPGAFPGGLYKFCHEKWDEPPAPEFTKQDLFDALYRIGVRELVLIADTTDGDCEPSVLFNGVHEGHVYNIEVTAPVALP